MFVEVLAQFCNSSLQIVNETRVEASAGTSADTTTTTDLLDLIIEETKLLQE